MRAGEEDMRLDAARERRSARRDRERELERGRWIAREDRTGDVEHRRSVIAFFPRLRDERKEALHRRCTTAEPREARKPVERTVARLDGAMEARQKRIERSLGAIDRKHREDT